MHILNTNWPCPIFDEKVGKKWLTSLIAWEQIWVCREGVNGRSLLGSNPREQAFRVTSGHVGRVGVQSNTGSMVMWWRNELNKKERKVAWMFELK